MTDPPAIHYAPEPGLSVAAFRHVLVDSGMGPSRPIDDTARLRAILEHSGLIMTARLGDASGALVGLARCVTDFVWSCYVAELAVCPAAQGLGVGTGLLAETRRVLGPKVSLILVSVPEAVGFYARAGMSPTANVFWHRREQ